MDFVPQFLAMGHMCVFQGSQVWIESHTKPVEKGHRNLHETKTSAADYQGGIWRLCGQEEKTE